jgi:hypothetical protein
MGSDPTDDDTPVFEPVSSDEVVNPYADGRRPVQDDMDDDDAFDEED